MLKYIFIAVVAGALALTPFGPLQAQTAANRITLQRIVGDLASPVFVTHAGDARLFVVEKAGRIKIVKNGSLVATPFLDMTAKVEAQASERGLLGLAFEPDYASTGRFYVYYTRKPDAALTIARYAVSANPDLAASATFTELLAIPHPGQTNHNGGWLGFGPDRWLYIATGDGGGGGDPFCAAQNLNDLRGKVLRIEVRGQITYTSPASNIFTTTQRPEIWAFGLRNPWRSSFDRVSGDLYIGDVGQGEYEEINRVISGTQAGVNFGWSQREGLSAYANACPASGVPALDPILDYGRTDGSSVTGGYVVRDPALPALVGRYVFADYVTGRIWAALPDGQGGFTKQLQRDAPFNVSSFGEGVNGELYVLAYDGVLHRILPGPVTRARLPLLVK
jgi:hypothetical protein